MISIIVPVYNEEKILSGKVEFFKQLSKRAELIFVDGGSCDSTLKIIEMLGGRILRSQKGRAAQMNAGAKTARHDILLFLHADAYLPLDSLTTIEHVIHNNGYAGGCLHQVIDAPGLLFRWIAWTGNVRAKMFKIFYGDQGIFVRKDVFWSLGGFPEAPLAEDVLFSSRLRQEGKTDILPDPIYCSARRWVRQGVLKTLLFNTRVTVGLALNNNTERLARYYKDVR